MSENKVTLTLHVRRALLEYICRDVYSHTFLNELMLVMDRENPAKCIGTCPYCKKEGFYYNQKTGEYLCKNCIAAGDLLDLILLYRGGDMDRAIDFGLRVAEKVREDLKKLEERRQESQRRYKEKLMGGKKCLPE